MPHWKKSFPVDLAEEGHFSRREFVRFLAMVSAGFTAGIGYLALRKQPLAGAPDSVAAPVGPLRVCPASELAPGNSRLFTYRDDRDRCILVRTRQGTLKAYRQTCTHLGCSVRWDGQRLECPCHHGYFEVDRGFPVQGPPTRPLSALAAVEQDGFIWVIGDLPKPTLSQEKS
jgi:Rieske Fe-S protein